MNPTQVIISNGTAASTQSISNQSLHTPGGSSTVLPFLSAFFNLLIKAIAAVHSLFSCSGYVPNWLARSLAPAERRPDALSLIQRRKFPSVRPPQEVF